MRTQLQHRRREIGGTPATPEIGIGQVTLMDIGKSKMLADTGDAVELTGWNIIAHHVAAIISKPQLAGYRMPVETNRIANAAGYLLHTAAIEIHGMQ